MDSIFDNTEFVGPAEYLIFLAAILAYREESMNGINGVLGVLNVIRNRVEAGFGDGDVFKVMTQKGAFASLSLVGDSQTVVYPRPNDPLFQRALQAAPNVLRGDTDDVTFGALYYADLSSSHYDKSGWFARTVVGHPERFPRLSVIGSTTYFGDKKEQPDANIQL